jgi:hypothetical protein
MVGFAGSGRASARPFGDPPGVGSLAVASMPAMDAGKGWQVFQMARKDWVARAAASAWKVSNSS